MKNWIFILLFALLAACSDEEELTPTEVRDWYVITPTDDMDEVDTKIYELFQKYDLAVFYKDTIGSEDRGWKDEYGNPKLYYEVLRLDYDMTTSTTLMDKFESIPLDVSTPEKKAEMLPLLKLMDEKLFAWIENAQIFIPAVLVVEKMRRGFTDTFEGTPVYVYRGFGVLGFAMNSYDQPQADSLIQRTFLQQVCYGAMQDVLDDFQSIVKSALETTPATAADIKDCWGKDVDVFASGYSNKLENLNLMSNNKRIHDQYVNRNAEIEILLMDEKLTEEEREKLQSEYDTNQLMIETLSQFIVNYDEYYAFCTQNDPRNYGLMGYILETGSKKHRMPTAEEDFNNFLESLWEYSEEEFREMYADYPYVQARYSLMKQTLENVGFDVDRIKTDLNESKNTQQ